MRAYINHRLRSYFLNIFDMAIGVLLLLPIKSSPNTKLSVNVCQSHRVLFPLTTAENLIHFFDGHTICLRKEEVHPDGEKDTEGCTKLVVH